MKEWVNSVVFVALIPLLGWMALQLYEMKPTVVETSRRVDRIVDVLPQVKVRIAQEDMQKRVKLAFLVADPVEISAGKWVTRLHLFDFGAGRVRTYDIPVKGPDDVSGAYLVTGLANGIGLEKISFADYTAAAAEIGKPKAISSTVDMHASFAIIKASPRYDDRLVRLFGPPNLQRDIDKRSVLLEQLADELAKKALIYDQK
jgi:hypothetical protein